MRISFIIPNIGVSGGIKTVLEYADFLAHQQHSVTVLYPAEREASIIQRAKDFIRGRKRAKPAQFSSSFLNALQVKPQRSNRIGALLVSDLPDADIVVATWWETAEWVNDFPAEKGVKAYFVQDHEVFEGLPKERVKRTYLMPFRKIVVSRWLVEVMAREYADHSVKLVRNGVDTDRLQNRPGSRGKCFTVGMVYSSAARKNSRMGLESMIEARRSRPELKAVIFGTEPRPMSIAGLDWMEYHCQPDQEDIPELYRRSHVWLFPSHSEGFGLPLLEAMASGTPVIATRAGAAPDIVDGHNGVLVDWDCKSMASEILRIAAMESDAWLKMSHHARATAEANSWRTAATEFERALLEIQLSKP